MISKQTCNIFPVVLTTVSGTSHVFLFVVPTLQTVYAEVDSDLQQN